MDVAGESISFRLLLEVLASQTVVSWHKRIIKGCGKGSD